MLKISNFIGYKSAKVVEDINQKHSLKKYKNKSVDLQENLFLQKTIWT